MITLKVIVVVAVAAVLSTAFAVASQSFVDFLATAQDNELRKYYWRAYGRLWLT